MVGRMSALSHQRWRCHLELRRKNKKEAPGKDGGAASAKGLADASINVVAVEWGRVGDGGLAGASISVVAVEWGY